MKIYLLLFFSLLLIPACSSSGKLGDNEHKNLLDYNIKLTQGGGFTNEMHGYIIDSTGAVSSFSALPKTDEKTTYKGKMNNDQIAELNKMFSSILKTKYIKNDNMTTSILLTGKNSELTYSWGGIEPGKDVPVELTRFYEKINNIINNLKD